MVSRLIVRMSFLRKIYTLNSFCALNSTPKVGTFPKVFLFGAAPYNLFHNNARDNMENFDLKLKDACERGEAAVVEFMDILKTGVTETAKAYKDCLQKQIEIIDEATKIGNSSSKWDELPEYRTLAADLNQQFQCFMATINTLGEVAKNETLKYITQQEKMFKILESKHKEIAKVMNNQLQEIKKLENKLLEKNRTSIEKTR